MNFGFVLYPGVEELDFQGPWEIVGMWHKYSGGPVPVLEDDVELGAYAQVLGGVRIGKGAKVGAMSVVLLVATFAFLALAAPVMKRKYDLSGSGK